MFSVIIFTFFQLGCSRNVCKFGAQKEKQQPFCSSSHEKSDSINQKIDNNIEQSTCSICLEQYTNNYNFIKLICDDNRPNITHNFHKFCMNLWISSRETCPICRSDIPQIVIDEIKRINIFQAIEDEDVEKVQFFIQCDPSILVKIYSLKPMNCNRVYYTPLHHAIQCNSALMVKELLQVEGINVNIRDINGCTPIYLAAVIGHTEMVKILLEKAIGINVNQEDRYGNTPLNSAVANNHIEIVKLLLKVPGINKKADSNGKTLLHSAVMEGHIEIVKILLKIRDIDINQQDKYGCTPLDLAYTKKEINEDMVILLEQHDANISPANKYPKEKINIRSYSFLRKMI
ncbi:ankyrin repeat domain-containing protein [Cardinium endosymbiont of Tipula unca]|uniref:ankyrin repeat domain-containing protein n=1 Tax=Cardinium endosymbiont of Tipula unca TaxID=3066216 RepID=UPI0030D43864